MFSENDHIDFVYCINRSCQRRNNVYREGKYICEECETPLIVAEKYLLIGLIYPNQNNFSDDGYGTEVFRALDVHTSQLKAIKIIKETRGRDSTLFDREAEILLYRLNHSSICSASAYFIYCLPQNTRLKVLVLEYIEGIDLKSYLEKSQVSLTNEQAIQWLIQLLEILDYIHGQRVLHLDIKPSNIMLKPDGTLILIDFGIAKFIPDNMPISFTPGDRSDYDSSTIAFTFDYAPPEQRLGHTRYTQSDIFALGRTFVHLLTNLPPSRLVISHNSQTIINWRSQVSFPLSLALANWVDRMISISMEDRPNNARKILSHSQGGTLHYPHYSHILSSLLSFFNDVYPLIANLILFLILSMLSVRWLYAYENHRDIHKNNIIEQNYH